MYLNPRTRAGQGMFLRPLATQSLGGRQHAVSATNNRDPPFTPRFGVSSSRAKVLVYSPPGARTLVYFDAFLGVDNYASAYRAPRTPEGLSAAHRDPLRLARDRVATDPAAEREILAALPPEALSGGRVFWNEERTQVVLEVGGRRGTKRTRFHDGAIAVGARVQHSRAEPGAPRVRRVHGQAGGSPRVVSARGFTRFSSSSE